MDNDASSLCGGVTFVARKTSRLTSQKRRSSNRKTGSLVTSEQEATALGFKNMSRSNSEPRISINVGGKLFQSYASTLQRFPRSRLAILTRNDVSFDVQDDEYFFDRSSKMFDSILDCYRTGELHFPHCFCGPVVRRELEFWGLHETLIAPCCWKSFKFYEEEEKALEMLEKTFATETTKIASNPHNHQPNTLRYEWTRWRRQVLSFLEDPHSSRAAKVSYSFVAQYYGRLVELSHRSRISIPCSVAVVCGRLSESTSLNYIS